MWQEKRVYQRMFPSLTEGETDVEIYKPKEKGLPFDLLSQSKLEACGLVFDNLYSLEKTKQHLLTRQLYIQRGMILHEILPLLEIWNRVRIRANLERSDYNSTLQHLGRFVPTTKLPHLKKYIQLLTDITPENITEITKEWTSFNQRQVQFNRIANQMSTRAAIPLNLGSEIEDAEITSLRQCYSAIANRVLSRSKKFWPFSNSFEFEELKDESIPSINPQEFSALWSYTQKDQEIFKQINHVFNYYLKNGTLFNKAILDEQVSFETRLSGIFTADGYIWSTRADWIKFWINPNTGQHEIVVTDYKFSEPHLLGGEYQKLAQRLSIWMTIQCLKEIPEALIANGNAIQVRPQIHAVPPNTRYIYEYVSFLRPQRIVLNFNQTYEPDWVNRAQVREMWKKFKEFVVKIRNNRDILEPIFGPVKKT